MILTGHALRWPNVPHSHLDSSHEVNRSFLVCGSTDSQFIIVCMWVMAWVKYGCLIPIPLYCLSENIRSRGVDLAIPELNGKLILSKILFSFVIIKLKLLNTTMALLMCRLIE